MLSQSVSPARAILVSSHAITTYHTWVMVHSFHLLLLLLVCCCCRHCRRFHCHCLKQSATKSAKNDDKHCKRMKQKTNYILLRSNEEILNQSSIVHLCVTHTACVCVCLGFSKYSLYTNIGPPSRS